MASAINFCRCSSSLRSRAKKANWRIWCVEISQSPRLSSFPAQLAPFLSFSMSKYHHMLPNKHEYEYEYQLFYLENIPFGATSITKNNNIVSIFILSFCISVQLSTKILVMVFGNNLVLWNAAGLDLDSKVIKFIWI